jgi:deazaflavin-dependent oxidoreductase (nitroreductase family)
METVPEISFKKRLRERVRYFNREYFNPFSLSFAGRPNSFWSVILHRGRKTGQAYTTPIVAVRQKDNFVIPLPYGRHVDWFRNVMAAGGCDLVYQGMVYHATEPEIIPVETGIEAFLTPSIPAAPVGY